MVDFTVYDSMTVLRNQKLFLFNTVDGGVRCGRLLWLEISTLGVGGARPGLCRSLDIQLPAQTDRRIMAEYKSL